MAHSCPECGSTCYCGTDIDDCLFDFDEDVAACTHCDGEASEADYDDAYDLGRCGECGAAVAYGNSHDPECSYG